MYTDTYATAGATRADHAYAELKRRLLSGEFPLNVRLGEERLASLIGMSRTPIREALFRLHAEGLVERWPDGGFRPVAPDVSVMRDIYEVRAALEIAAIRRPSQLGRQHDRELLVSLRDDWLQLIEEVDHEPDPGFVAVDESFHITLAEAAGNSVLVDQLRLLNDRIRVVRMQDFMVEGRIRTTVAEHLEILDALLAGHSRKAEQLLSDHIGASIGVVEDRVRRAVTRMVQGVGES
jgi:DNA-binding GntR family transcriptional regulator